MKNLQDILEQLPYYLIIAWIIIFWAFVHATANMKISLEKGQKFTGKDFIILLPIAMFAGLVFAMTSTLITENQTIIILSAAVGSFLGLAGLNRISFTLLEFLSKQLPKEK